jgi:ApeA N-terminal domain 1
MASLSDLLKDSPLGSFWLPGQDKRQVPGVIVERDGVLQLELMELLVEASDSSSTKRPDFYPVIHGWLSKGGAVSLYNCVSGQNESIPGNEWERCSFAYAIKQRPENEEDLYSDAAAIDLFKLANVQFGGLVEWVRVNGLQQDWQMDSAVHGGRRWMASYVLPKPFVYRVDPGLTVKLLATCHFSNVGLFGLQILQDAAVEISCQEAVRFAKLEAKVHGIRQLLMLLSGLELRPTWNHVGLFSDEDALPVFRNQASRPSIEPAHPQLHTFVPFEDISAELPELLSRWEGVQKSYGDAVATGLFTPYLSHTYETKISNLVNCLVRYAEADAGGEKVLKQEVRSQKGGVAAHVVEKAARRYRPTAREDFLSDLKEKIESTRHYYTHFNPDKKEIAAEGAELANLVDFLDVINRCVLLEKLGLEKDRVIQWVHKSHEYGKRFRMERFQELGA